MDKRHVVAAAAVLAALLGAGARGQGWSGDANVLVAGKHLDADDWGETDRQGEIGVITNWRGPDWPVSLAADLLASGRDETIASGGFTEQRGRTSELDLGARKVWRPDAVLRPFVGGGLALASGEIVREGPFGTVSERDSGFGLWVDGGVFWTLNQAFNLGLDARLSGASVHLFGRDRNAGGFHLGLMAGYHWGG